MNKADERNLAVLSVLSDQNFNVFQARRAFQDMESWALCSEALRLPEHEVELELEKRSREIARLLLQAHINERGFGEVGEVLEVHTGQSGHYHKRSSRLDPKRVISIFGEVVVLRKPYVAEGCESIHPLDEELELPKRSFSWEMQRRIVEEAVRGPFEEAIESIERSTGNLVSKRTAEQVTVDAAKDFSDFYAQRSGPSSEVVGPILVAAIDCKGVPMVKGEGLEHTPRRNKGEKVNKKRMATVAAVYTQRKRIRTAEEVIESLFEHKGGGGVQKSKPERKRVWASLEKSKEEVIEEVAEEMKARDREGKKRWVALTDGERALQLRVLRLLPRATLVLDFFHVLEKLWKAAYAFYEEGSKEAAEWVRKRAIMILEGKVSQVVKGMRQSATKRRFRGRRLKVVKEVSSYLYKNRQYMRYNEYLEQGFPIASGVVEGACKNLIKDRMERSGMRWQLRGAEAMLKLRAIKLSGDMEEYWKYHIEQDHRRLYGKRRWRIAA